MRDTVLPRALGDATLGPQVLEIGPGYGPVTEIMSGILAPHGGTLTCVELDPELASALASRFPAVTVARADAARLPFADARFSAAVCCTMLHHVPTALHQDAILAEVRRVLRPGGVFTGSDSMDSDGRRAFHEGDVFNPVDPAGLATRLSAAGFADPVVAVHDGGDYFTFQTRRR